MKDNIKQFKLTNNEEIICEVIQWPENDDVDEAILVLSLIHI